MAIYADGIFSSGIDVLFENGESAINAAILAGGTMRIGKGGTVDKVVLGSGGKLVVSSGGSARNVSQAVGGCLDFSVYGEDLATSITGSSFHGGDIATRFSLSGGLASGFYLYASATGKVHSGGRADSTHILNRGNLEIFSGGSGYVTNIAAGGSMTVHNGGYVNSVNLSNGGVLAVSSGAVVSGVNLSAGGVMKVTVTGNDSATVVQGNGFSLQNGIASNFTTYAGGELELVSGGSAKDITVFQGGTLKAGVNDHVSGLNLASGGILKLAVAGGGTGSLTGAHQFGNFSVKNGIASNFIIYTGGELSLYSSGSARSVIVSSGGLLTVGSDCTLSGATIISGGSLTVSNGGAASGVVLGSGAVLNLDLNGSGNTSIAGSNIIYAENLSGYIYLPFEVKSSASGKFYTSGLYLYAGAHTGVSSGGSVTAMTICSSGRLTVGDGGYASGITQLPGGILDVNVCGNDTSTFISGVCSNVRFTLSRGSAANFWIYPGADFTVGSGGTATGLLLYSGGRLHTTVGGSDGAKQITGAYSCDGYGGTFQLSNASANGFQIFSDCRFTVASNGNATNLGLYEGGILQVTADGRYRQNAVTGIHHASGFSSFALTSACASGFVIYNSGYLTVISGASALRTTVANGGLLTVDIQGKASGTTILAGGRCVVSSRGTAVDMTVQKHGHAVFHGGAGLTGKVDLAGSIEVAGSGIVQCTGGLTLRLLADQRDVSDASLPFIDDFSRLFGPVSMTVRTDYDQAMGVYVLAGNASNYTRPVNLTVIDDAGYESSIGSLSLSMDEPLFYRNNYYELTLDASHNLCLSISMPGYDTPLHVPEVSVECNGNDVSAQWTHGVSVTGNDDLVYEAELYLDGTKIFSKNVSGDSLDLGTLAPNYKPGSEYEFRVRAVDDDSLTGSGRGDWSSYSFMLEDTEAPDPGNVNVTQNGSRARVSWSGFADNGAIKWYDVTLDDVTRRVAGSITGYTFDIPEELYGLCEVEVSAVDHAGNRTTVTESFYCEDLLAPEKVILISQTPKGSGRVELKWRESADAGSGGDHYLIEFGYMNTPDQVRLISVDYALESYMLNDLGKGDYGWRVCAVDHAGNQGEWSDTRYFRL